MGVALGRVGIGVVLDVWAATWEWLLSFDCFDRLGDRFDRLSGSGGRGVEEDWVGGRGERTEVLR